MRISELVDKLNDLRMKHGDIQVLSCPPVNMACLIGSDEFLAELKSVEISSSAQKCFRKATVKLGKGAHPTYAPELNFPTIYLTFDK